MDAAAPSLTLGVKLPGHSAKSKSAKRLRKKEARRNRVRGSSIVGGRSTVMGGDGASDSTDSPTMAITPGGSQVSRTGSRVRLAYLESDVSVQRRQQAASVSLHDYQEVVSTREKAIVVDGDIRQNSTGSVEVLLNWAQRPDVVLLIKKPNDSAVTRKLYEVAQWLQNEGVRCLVEPAVQRELPDLHSIGNPSASDSDGEEAQDLSDKVDFVISLGGDGTILHASSLFKGACPPLFAINMGSMGFLTPFAFENYEKDLRRVIAGNQRVVCRMRLRSIVYRQEVNMLDNDRLLSVNEVVIERGPNPWLTALDCYVDGQFLTTVQADGFIIATSTGSTAYSLSAGSVITHPGVGTILLTPICPHSLSFRPIAFPDTAEIKFVIPRSARASAFASFDGRNRVEIKQGDSLVIHASRHPVPCITRGQLMEDWLEGLSRCLHWNRRVEQGAKETNNKKKIKR